MIKYILVFMLIMVGARSSVEESDLAFELKSRLDQSVTLEEFGEIRYRAPLKDNKGPIVVLFHGIYVGSSHQSYRELLPFLDGSGARVWIMDLPGCGESDRPKRTYDLAVFDQFLTLFLEKVVKEPASVVAQYVIAESALQVAKTRPELFQSLVLLSPTGIKRYSKPPVEEDQELYKHLLNNEFASRAYFANLFNEHALNFLLKKSFFHDQRIQALLMAERRLAADNLEQRWVTFSFTTGQLHRHFAEASADVKIPVRLIFGKSAEAMTIDKNEKDTLELFRQIRPHFDYVNIEDSGHAIHKEQPEATAAKILEFVSRPNGTVLGRRRHALFYVPRDGKL